MKTTTITPDRILKLLADGYPRSTTQIGKPLNLTRTPVHEAVTALHGNGLRVADWDYSATKGVALSSLGDEPDAPKRVAARRDPLSARAARMAYQDKVARRKLQAELSRPAFRHPWDEWFFGPYAREAA